MTMRVKIGETGTQFLQRTGLEDSEENVIRTADRNTYSHDWNPKKPGTVYIEYGEHSIEIPHVMYMTGVEDVANLQEGIYRYHIAADITATREPFHDEARKNHTLLLQMLLKAGWRQNMFYLSPRLSGEEAYSYFSQEEMGVGLPVDYVPTLEQWMSVEGFRFLYADDIFMTLGIRRDPRRLDLDKPGSYMLTLDIYSKEMYAQELIFPQQRAQFAGEQREQWQTLWVEKIKGMKRERYAKEKALAAQGYTINTGYQEPKIHPADPVEP